MSPFSSKVHLLPFVLLFSLILGRCTTTYEFQNYHRSAVKTPAQYYPISQVDIPSTPRKGDLSLSVGFTKSGRNEEDPKEDYREDEGKANLTNLTYATGTASYAFNDRWTVSASGSRGSDVKSIEIKRYAQTVNHFYTEADVLLTLLTLGLYQGQISTSAPASIQALGKVERRYKYWNASVGAGYYLPAMSKRFSVHAGVAKGESKLTGTTHAEDARTYPNDQDAPPATYGTHEARYTSVYLQPAFRLRPETSLLNVGMASKLSYYDNTVSTRISNEIKYTENVKHLLLQPSVFAAFGAENMKFTVAYSRLIPLANKTHDHFNANYFHFGLKARIPTKSH